LAVGVLLGIGWWITYSAGGNSTVMPHLFYVPLVIAARRFSQKGALIAAVTAGLLVGPLMR